MKMEIKVFSVYDYSAEAFINPFMAHSDNEAVRMFTNLVNNETGSNPHMFPNDFVLFELGTFDNCSGKYDCNDVPKKVVEATAVKEEKSSQNIEDVSELQKSIQALNQLIQEFRKANS